MKNKHKVSILILICILFLGFVYKTFIHHQDTYEIGIARNQFTGEISLIDKGGFHFNYPWVWVSIIDTRPLRVCISTTARAFKCRLVQFDKEHYKEFVQVEGWSYYWWSNRISFNYGYSEEYRGMKDILRGHAFGQQQYPFLKIVDLEQ